MPYRATASGTSSSKGRYPSPDQEYDDELGFYNYGARLYDPVLGKFLSPDSIVQAPDDPQTLYRCSYARNNRLYYTAPTTHEDTENEGAYGPNPNADEDNEGLGTTPTPTSDNPEKGRSPTHRSQQKKSHSESILATVAEIAKRALDGFISWEVILFLVAT